jgi:hypothetical protein
MPRFTRAKPFLRLSSTFSVDIFPVLHTSRTICQKYRPGPFGFPDVLKNAV